MRALSWVRCLFSTARICSFRFVKIALRCGFDAKRPFTKLRNIQINGEDPLFAARSGLFFIPLIFILPYFFGLLGVEMCQMWADCCSFAVAVPIAWSAFRDMRREQMELGKSH